MIDARPKGDDGFTLIETLVAFLILAIALAVFSRSVMQATSQIGGAETAIAARQVAERVLAQASATSVAQSQGTADGLAWRWTRRTVERFDDAGPLRPFALVMVEVARDGSAPPLVVLRGVARQGPSR